MTPLRMSSWDELPCPNAERTALAVIDHTHSQWLPHRSGGLYCEANHPHPEPYVRRVLPAPERRLVGEYGDGDPLPGSEPLVLIGTLNGRNPTMPIGRVQLNRRCGEL